VTSVNVAITGVAASALVVGHQPTIITSHAFAPYWFDDLLREAEGQPPHAVRRGVVAAAAFLENYWFAWAQRLLLSRGARGPAIIDHFRKRDNPGDFYVPSLSAMWRAGLKDLGLRPLPEDDALSLELKHLASWRHSLMHGRTSRLRISTPDELAAPDLTLAELEQTDPRWPLDVALRCIRYLHEQSPADLPTWIAQHLAALDH
jgi:hypothetical protein